MGCREMDVVWRTRFIEKRQMRRSSDQFRRPYDADEELHRLREMFAQSPSFSALLHGPNTGSS